jgi:ATP-independent RNA helicase DbpA
MHKVDALDLGLDPQKFSDPLPSESLLDKPVKKPLMATIKIDGGKKQKIRPGDIVGALTGDGGIAGDSVGKINVSANWSYVAVQLNLVKPALKKLSNGKLKGRSFRVKLIS